MLVYNKTSEAHDFELFESHRTEKKREPEIKIKEGSKSVAKSGSIFKILLATICAIAFPLYLVSSKVELSELTGKISSAQVQLEQAQNENMRLQAELDNLVTLARVEEFAQNELGMQKITTSQGKHISLNTGGTTEVVTDDSPVTFISRWFSSVLEYLGFK
ncbi:MAG: cell division protein FtsL [Oscillospiraceae bacterium]|jgi:cell division protein FtsL|nr:cell division protein FtsL [Oscillospiraceae bacterium]